MTPLAIRRGWSTPSGSGRRRESGGPKHKTSVMAIGRWAAPSTSRITPPTPVLAPPNGSIADGWLWVSALTAMVVPGASTRRCRRCRRTPTRTNGASIASVQSRKLLQQRWIVRAVVGGDARPERLVRAVLAPRLGERLELDVGRARGPTPSEVLGDGVQLGEVERQATLAVRALRAPRRRGRDVDRSTAGRRGLGIDERGSIGPIASAR